MAEVNFVYFHILRISQDVSVIAIANWDDFVCAVFSCTLLVVFLIATDNEVN